MKLWENGEDTRDLAAKGISDRGEGELVDGTTPTKVRGQMSPGGQMPSITLKGVSIKGVSKVNYSQVCLIYFQGKILLLRQDPYFLL